MSRIDELIAEHCPDGVSFQMLGDVTTKAAGIKWSALEAAEERRYIDLSSVDRVTKQIGETITVTASNAPSRARQIVKTDDVIFATTRPTQMRWALITAEYEDQIASTGYCVLRPRTELILPAFLAHVLGAKGFQHYVEANQIEGNYPSIPDSRVRAFKLPVPPLEVQRVIVEVLDTFSKLEVELEAELEARKQQYEHYRARLLAPSEASAFKPLGDLVRIKNGKDHKHLDEGDIPVYGSGGVMRYADAASAQGPSVLIPRKGSLGNLFYVEGPFWNVDTIFNTEIDDSMIEPKFLFHQLSTMKLGEMNQAGGVPSQTQSVLNRLRISVPPLDEQRHIVAILDKFDALVNDLSIGLPAELAARRQQYEYYRDKLLTFREAS